jgi:hypothetical protein
MLRALVSRIDPRDRIADFDLYGHALALGSAGRVAESSNLLVKLGRSSRRSSISGSALALTFSDRAIMQNQHESSSGCSKSRP